MINQNALERLNSSSEYEEHKERVKNSIIKDIISSIVIVVIILLASKYIYSIPKFEHLIKDKVFITSSAYLSIIGLVIFQIVDIINKTKIKECVIVKIVDIKEAKEWVSYGDTSYKHNYIQYICIDEQNNTYKARATNNSDYNIDDQVIYFMTDKGYIVKY